MSERHWSKYLLSLAVVSLLSACVASNNNSANDMGAAGGVPRNDGLDENGLLPDEFRIPSSIVLPSNTVVITDQSSVSGVAEPTTGFVVMRSKNSPNALVNFYRDKMPRDGWEPAGISQGQKFYVSFIRKEPTGGTRVASIRIVPISNTLSFGGADFNSEMELFVSEAAPR
jgi:hypothetical protein